MVHQEANPEPPPPNIRNYSHNSSSTNSVQTVLPSITGDLDTSDDEESDNSGFTSESQFSINKNVYSTKTGERRIDARGDSRALAPLGLFLPLFALALLPMASASEIVDPFTSYPAPVRATPILSFVGNSLSRVISFTGIDSTIVGHHAVMFKRQLDTSGIVECCMIPVLVALSGMFAGLTLGYFSVDPTQLQVLAISGTPKQQEYARLIMPIRKDSHLLLTTLILGNMIVNEALPVVMDSVVGGGILSVVISTALVVVFAEIIPQSICSRYGLLIGARMALPVRCLIWLAFPIAWPIAKLLQYILGAHHGIIYRRSELRELIKMHAAGGTGGGDLDFDTVQITQGALDLARKTVQQAMTPIDQVFMLPIEAKLDYETLGHVVRSGHSRIPVYQMVEVPDIDLAKPGLGTGKTKMVKKVLGSLLVKSCVLLDPEDATPLASIPINIIPTIPCDEPLTNMLNVFQEGRSHMAIVSRRTRNVPVTSEEAEEEDARSVMTAAAGGLRERFMRKVAEISHGNKSSSESDNTDAEDGDVEKGEKRKKQRRKRGERQRRDRASSGSSGTAVSPTAATEADGVKKAHESDEKKKEGKKGSLVQAAKLTQLEQTVPADAQMSDQAVNKFFEGLEGAPLGIITLEDVLEELIGEEIYDEYDQHGAPLGAASAFVPQEAALAARKAAIAREKLLAAQTTPLPVTNDADLEPKEKEQPPRRVMGMSKFPLPLARLGIKKGGSQPGKARSTVETATPISATPPPGVTSVQVDEKPIAAPQMATSPGEMETASGPAKRLSIPIDAVATSTTSAMPAPPHPPTRQASTLLSEALFIERERRRLASQPGYPRSSSVGPSRQATPPIAASQGTVAGPFAAAGGAGAGIAPMAVNPSQSIASPTPLNPGNKVPKFKSVPTPYGTPVGGERKWRDWSGDRKDDKEA